MAEIVEMKPVKRTLKDRWEDFKVNAKVKAHVAYDWCREHKEVLMVVVPAVIGAAGEVGKAVIKAKDHREERELEERKLCSVYDRSAGMYLDTTRELTNEDYIKIQSLKREGKTTGEALYELGLLDI